MKYISYLHVILVGIAIGFFLVGAYQHLELQNKLGELHNRQLRIMGLTSDALSFEERAIESLSEHLKALNEKIDKNTYRIHRLEEFTNLKVLL